MVRTIIFDLGNVIVPFDFRRGYARMEQLCPHAAEEIPKRLRSTDLVQRFETGEIEPREFVAQLCSALDLQVDYQGFCDLWTSIFLPDTLVPESLLDALKGRYRLLALSNTNAIHFEMVEANYPLLRHFADMVLSYKVGAAKPSPRIYAEAIARAQCAPGECLFIDDMPAFVEAARRAGMDALQFESVERLERDLRSRGVEW